MSMSPKTSPSALVQIIQTFRLAIKMFFNPKVPTWTKIIPVVALVYLFFPLDFLPDVIPGLGQLDDLTVILLFTWVFLQLVPQDLLNDGRSDGNVVEGEYHVVNDEHKTASSSDQITPPKS